MEARARELEAAGLARRQGSGFRFERNLIETLRAREIDAATDAIARRTGLTHRPSTEGDYVSGVYRERVTLASGRFAMVDDGRSEEHTSELQSLMRLSYAGFCLKKKNKSRQKFRYKTFRIKIKSKKH